MRFSTRLFLSSSAFLTLVSTLLIVLAHSVFAANSDEIAYESNRDGNWEIYLLDVQSGKTYNLTRDPADDLTPAWSPDGSQIAFVSNRADGKHLELYIMDADGGDLRRVASSPGQYTDPFWTPDGQSLVLTHGYEQIYRLSVATDSEQWLGTGFLPRLSPDGSALLYYADGTSPVNSHIYRLNLSTRQITDLTPGPTHNWNGVWSPDGRKIMFVSSRIGQIGLYIMNADGSDIQPILPGKNDLTPAWSPDGTQIVYASGVDGARQLYIVDADGADSHPITASAGENRSPAWRPRSHRPLLNS